tara:strand:- start:44 stop:478 length:435 start_codon:yes stop_codon:yes gene_type:complete
MNKCFECEATEDLQEHHVVPKSRGGTKTVILCYECHMKAHGRDGKGLNHRILTKEALAEAKKRGVKLGSNNPKVMKGITAQKEKTMSYVIPHIMEAKQNGCNSNRTIANYLNEKGIQTPRGSKFSKASMTRYLRHMKENSLEDK